MLEKTKKLRLFFLLLIPNLLFAGGVPAPTHVNLPMLNVKNNNVILITISSLRADHMSCFGYDRNTTENFDKFAKENLLFTKAYSSASWQMPAIGSLFTSNYPSRHGATHIANKLGIENLTIAEALKGYGFYTSGFSCNPRLTSDYGFGQGFDYYDDFSVSMMLESLDFGQDEKLNINTKRTNDLINDAAIRWLEKNAHKPFFMFVHYYDTHWDYLPPEPYKSMYDPNYSGDVDGYKISKEPLYSNMPSDADVEHIIALYDGEVTQTDKDLGQLLDYLKQAGRFEDSIIVIMADHGEQFYEHGHTSHHGVFEELVRIPIAISLPDMNEPAIIDSFVSCVDIVPTILDYLSIPAIDSIDGKSLKPLIVKTTDVVRDYVFTEYTGGAVPDTFAARFKRYKYIWQDGGFFAYDLKVDSDEQRKIFENDFTSQMNIQFESVKDILTKNIKEQIVDEN